MKSPHLGKGLAMGERTECAAGGHGAADGLRGTLAGLNARAADVVEEDDDVRVVPVR